MKKIIIGEFQRWVGAEKHAVLAVITVMSGGLSGFSTYSYISRNPLKVSNSVQSDAVKDKIAEFKDYFNIAKAIIPNMYIWWVIFALCIIAWIAIIYCRNKNKDSPENNIFKGSKNNICVLGHSTMDVTQFKLSEEDEKKFELNISEILLREDMQKIGREYETIKYVVSTQDSLVEQFRSQIDSSHTYGYMGLAHTPLIMRSGFKIGDGTKFAMFHKNRGKDYYEQLDKSDTYTPMKIEKKEIKNNSKELIVAISTTFQIGDNQLQIFQPQNKSLIKFKSDTTGFDVIVSEKQVMDYVGFIFKEIREIVKKQHIEKIHMVVSSSTIFTFVLGQSLSDHYDPETIIYHFDGNNSNFYPWGISLFKNASECIVVNN